ncbi:hypothetical protein [Natronosalvus vescus]|uniref:hypothetical protein n=1 Tax=Natronosalvus vescus TaxID=2953881 RepID=UPI0020908EEC|nr:hypothetical protein [Natronosalvus vescus]
MTGSPSSTRWGHGSVLAAAGIVLLAHPAYVSSLSVYPGTDWGFLPLFHAAFTALGLLAVSAGGLLVRHGRIVPPTRELLVVTTVTAVAVPLYGIVLLQTYGTSGPIMEGYGIKRAFVGGLVVGSFLIGFSLSSRRWRAAAAGGAIPSVPAAFVAFEWVLVVLEYRPGALLGPVVDVWFLLTAAPLLEIPYLGTGILLVAGTLGFWMGVPAKRATPESNRRESASGNGHS